MVPRPRHRLRAHAACFVLLTLSLVAGEARADGPPGLLCPDLQSRDCFVGDIFVIDGGAYEDANAFGPCYSTDQCRDKTYHPNAEPNRVCVNSRCLSETVWCTDEDPAMPQGCALWKLESGQAVEKAIKLLRSGGHPVRGWEQVLVWATDYENNVVPWFERLLGKNEVDGIGLPRPSRDPLPEFPFIGWIHAGPTNRVEHELDDAYPCPGLPCNFTEGLVSQLDVLAAASASMFGPAVKFRTKDPLQTSTAALNIPGGFGARVWSSFLDTENSLLGGMNWRPNGDGTYETAFPKLFQPPLIFLTFTPLDLYLMGFGPKEDVQPMLLFDGVLLDLVRPLPKPSWFGAAMPLVPGVRIRPKTEWNRETWTITVDDIINASGVGSGPREPSFEAARHHMRQLWLAVTIPGVSPPESTTENGRTVDGALPKLVRWREMFNWYFYLHTRHRGRMVTTYEGNVDDTPYWEFADARDDRRAFQEGGGLVVREITDGHVVVDTNGTGFMRFSGNPLPIRIHAGKRLGHRGNNVITVRMRIAPDSGIAPKEAHAAVQFEGHPVVLIPGAETGQEKSFLIPDGLWHTYSANLGDKEFWKSAVSFDSFFLFPSDKSGTRIEIDSVRVLGTENSGDNDAACRTGQPMPDGWVDDFDNCPAIFNPRQEDGNLDGVGDACEDFDTDGVPNACDNCPTFTNSRQRDSDGDRVGDNCDETPDPGRCCLEPARFVGPAPPGPFAGVLLLAVAALLLRRRRR